MNENDKENTSSDDSSESNREMIIFDIDNDNDNLKKIVQRETIYEEAQGFIFDNNDNDYNITKEKTNISFNSNQQEELEMKQLLQEKYRRLELMIEDINNIPGDTIDFISKNYRRITPKNYGIDDLHMKSLYELQNFPGDVDVIWVMKFSSDGKYLATAGRSGVLKIWEVMSYEDSIDSYDHNRFFPFLQFFNETAFRIYTDHTADIIDLSWSEKHSDILVTVSIDHKAIMYDLNKETAQGIYQHDSIVSCVAFYPNLPVNIFNVTNEDDVFITGCFDEIVRIWGKSTTNPVAVIQMAEYVTALSFFPEGAFIAMGNSVGKISIYECIEKLRYSYSFSCRNKKGKFSNGRKVTGIFFKDRKEAIITTNDSRIRIVNGFNGNVVRKYKGHLNEETLIRSGYDELNGVIISASDNGYVYLWKDEHNSQAKTRMYEYYRPFENKKEVPSCSVFVEEKWIKDYNKKLQKVTQMIYLKNIMINTSHSGNIQVVLNHEIIRNPQEKLN